jgi:type I restriction enzyme M protein
MAKPAIIAAPSRTEPPHGFMTHWLVQQSRVAHMPTDPASRLRAAFGLPATHPILSSREVGSFPIFTVHNERATAYLALALASGDDRGAEQSLRDTLSASPSMGVGALVDSHFEPLRILRKNFRTGDFDRVASLDTGARLAPAERIPPSALRPLNERVEDLLFELHSALRDIDGLHAPEALDEMCKLLYAKLHDEENAQETRELLFQRAGHFSAEECAAQIRQLYSDAVAHDRARGHPTGVFKQALLLSGAAIVRAVDLLQQHDLCGSPVDIKGRAFQNVLAPAMRSGMGQYFTPKAVIDLVVRMVAPGVRDKLIDPFCGSGQFLASALDFVRGAHARSDPLFQAFARTSLHGIEKSERMVRIAMTDMRLHGEGHSHIRCADALASFSNDPDLQRESFDLVVTNPPFGIDLPIDSLHQLGPFEPVPRRKAFVSLEVLALQRCLQLLKPGGRLAIVLPDGVLNNRNARYVRDWLLQQALVRAIVSLPVETFAPFGASVKTSILLARKLRAGEQVDPARAVFMGEVSDPGHDARGRRTATADLDALLQAFQRFLSREAW